MPARIVVGLSGGVDSALAAALLKERGFDVFGVYFKIRQSAISGQRSAVDDGRSVLCPWRDDIVMCRRVAARLDIPFYVVDVSAEYHETVVLPFIESYARGDTPNPDVLCNRWVKFDLLLREARAVGAEKIATGHYARIVRPGVITSETEPSAATPSTGSPELLRRAAPRNDIELWRGADRLKDQSYFLWMLTQEQFAATEFPLGMWRKVDVRAEAQRRGFPNWDRRSSRGVCFLGPLDIAAFMRGYTTPVTANVVTTMGECIGTTSDAQILTIGQRISIGGQPAPRYVVTKDLAKKVITVSDEPNDPARAVSSFDTSEPHWVGPSPELPLSCDVRIRHRQEPVKCGIDNVELIMDNSGRATGLRVKLGAPLIGVAPGQAAVFSIGDRVLGGAVIRRA